MDSFKALCALCHADPDVVTAFHSITLLPAATPLSVPKPSKALGEPQKFRQLDKMMSHCCSPSLISMKLYLFLFFIITDRI